MSKRIQIDIILEEDNRISFQLKPYILILIDVKSIIQKNPY